MPWRRGAPPTTGPRSPSRGAGATATAGYPAVHFGVCATDAAITGQSTAFEVCATSLIRCCQKQTSRLRESFSYHAICALRAYFRRIVIGPSRRITRISFCSWSEHGGYHLSTRGIFILLSLYNHDFFSDTIYSIYFGTMIAGWKELPHNNQAKNISGVKQNDFFVSAITKREAQWNALLNSSTLSCSLASFC